MRTPQKDFNYSYWERKVYFTDFDLIVIGSGIVGLSTAIAFKEKNKKAKILILERGIIPDGASTKNAGFACFGSPGEVLGDLSRIKEDIVWQTVKMRWEGLQLLRKRIGDKQMDFQQRGGYELFSEKKNYENCLHNLNFLNSKMKEVIGLKKCYSGNIRNTLFGKTAGIIKNNYEGQIDTGMMMQSLREIAQKKDIRLLNAIEVTKIIDQSSSVQLQTNAGVFKSRKVAVCTNGFARQLLKNEDVKPARAQVLITKPIAGLKVKGTFHFDEGYFYFRNIDNRILFGGGRNLDIKGETTFDTKLNNKIQRELDMYLRQIILPGQRFEVDMRWSGIMGVGKEKIPIIKNIGTNTLAAVRMGGMGIAIGSLVGQKAAEQLS